MSLKQTSMIMFQPIIFQRCKPFEFAQRILILKHEKPVNQQDPSSLQPSNRTSAYSRHMRKSWWNNPRRGKVGEVFCWGDIAAKVQGLKKKYKKKQKSKIHTKIHTHTPRPIDVMGSSMKRATAISCFSECIFVLLSLRCTLCDWIPGLQ